MKVLLTGAFGNLGLLCLERLLADGHELRCTDLDGEEQRKQAARFSGQCEIVFGNICEPQFLPGLAEGVEAIVHLASLLPPNTDKQPALAEAVNVDAAKALIDCAARQTAPPLFIFPSSLTVFGPSQRHNPTRSSDDPVEASDHYTRHKLLVEDYLQRSALPWIIMRVGVSVDARTTKTERQVLRQLLGVHPDTPMEYIHPKDVARAISNALNTPEARHKILLLGGGESCQITHHAFMNAAFTALGLAQKPGIHGENNYYTHWMDTRDAQALLDFQQHSFADYQQELRDKFTPIRRWTSPVRPLLRPLLPALLRRL